MGLCFSLRAFVAWLLHTWHEIVRWTADNQGLIYWAPLLFPAGFMQPDSIDLAFGTLPSPLLPAGAPLYYCC